MINEQPATLPGFESYAVDQPVVKAPIDRSENRAITIDSNQWGGLAKEGAERFPKGEYTGDRFGFNPQDADIPEGATIYHGSGYPFAEGETIKPSLSKFHGVPNAAYGTMSKDAAEYYANSQAREDGRLFGSVYTVAPKEGNFQKYQATDTGKDLGYALGETPLDPTNPQNSPYLGSESGLSQQFSHWTYPQAPRD